MGYLSAFFLEGVLFIKNLNSLHLAEYMIIFRHPIPHAVSHNDKNPEISHATRISRILGFLL